MNDMVARLVRTLSGLRQEHQDGGGHSDRYFYVAMMLLTVLHHIDRFHAVGALASLRRVVFVELLYALDAANASDGASLYTEVGEMVTRLSRPPFVPDECVALCKDFVELARVGQTANRRSEVVEIISAMYLDGQTVSKPEVQEAMIAAVRDTIRRTGERETESLQR